MLTEWLEKHLQEPFLLAEMVKTRVDIEQGAEHNLGAIKTMALLGSLYMAICAYWYAKYIF